MASTLLPSNETHPVPGKTTGLSLPPPTVSCCQDSKPSSQHSYPKAPDKPPISFTQNSWAPTPTSHLVVDVTICKHCVEVLDTFLSIPVIVVFQAFLYCSHIHRCFNDLIVILGSRKSKGQCHLSSHAGTARWPVGPTLDYSTGKARRVTRTYQSLSMVSVNDLQGNPKNVNQGRIPK